MNIKVIGTGAAGNAGAILLLKKNLLNDNEVFLINSTLSDVPEEFKKKVYIFDGSTGGCGKERELSKKLALYSLEKGNLQAKLKEFIGADTEQVIVLSSTEGGSGCGSAIILAQFINKVLKIPAQLFGFCGFEQDTRGLQNTLEYFQEIDENLTVQAISNARFTDEANGNILKAETLSDLEFLTRFSIMKGLGMKESEKNIDAMDLFKLVTTPGYMITGHKNFPKIKNVDQFNKFVSTLIDENASLETSPTAGRLGIIINASKDLQQNIDYNFSVFKDKFGTPYETFTHVQYDENQPEYISFIASGLKMPLDIVKETYEKYKKQSEKTNKDKDDFFDFMSELKGNSDDSMFNAALNKSKIGKSSEEDEKSFFDSFKKPKSRFSNTVSNGVKPVIQKKGDSVNDKY